VPSALTTHTITTSIYRSHFQAARRRTAQGPGPGSNLLTPLPAIILLPTTSTQSNVQLLHASRCHPCTSTSIGTSGRQQRWRAEKQNCHGIIGKRRRGERHGIGPDDESTRTQYEVNPPSRPVYIFSFWHSYTLQPARADDRAWNQLRPLFIDLGVVSQVCRQTFPHPPLPSLPLSSPHSQSFSCFRQVRTFFLPVTICYLC